MARGQAGEYSEQCAGMKERILLIGGGGHCRSCIDVIESEGRYAIAGIIDVAERVGEDLMGYPVIGTDDDIPRIVAPGCSAIVTVGQIQTAEVRKRLFALLEESGVPIPAIVSPSARVSAHAVIGGGTIIMHGAVINAGAVIGCNCIINTGALVEHDARIGDHCHVSTASVVNGGCEIREEVFVGSNSVISNNLSIARGVVIGAGSVVIKSVLEAGTYAGNPAGRVG